MYICIKYLQLIIILKYSCHDFFFSAFFVATQFFYTLSFIAILIAIILVLMYLLCVDDYYRVSVLRWTGIDLIVAGKHLFIFFHRHNVEQKNMINSVAFLNLEIIDFQAV